VLPNRHQNATPHTNATQIALKIQARVSEFSREVGAIAAGSGTTGDGVESGADDETGGMGVSAIFSAIFSAIYAIFSAII
jgi:hypothetical protein